MVLVNVGEYHYLSSGVSIVFRLHAVLLHFALHAGFFSCVCFQLKSCYVLKIFSRLIHLNDLLQEDNLESATIVNLYIWLGLLFRQTLSGKILAC